MTSLKQLWVDKYRPAALDGYVFQDELLRLKIEEIIKDKTIPHLLFKGGPGTGKTTLAKIILNEIGVQSTDILEVNGSKEGRKIEWVDKLITFCSTMPFGEFKVVLIDEADYMNPNSVQPALRSLMEDYSSSVRFILTCNYPNKLIAPLLSRFQKFQIEKSSSVQFTEKVATILINEEIEFDLETLDLYIKLTYPDLRNCINTLQANCSNGVLNPPTSSENESDYRSAMVELFKQGKVSEARKLICSQILPEEIDEMYRWLYDNIELFGDEEQQEKAILIIKQGLVDHTLVIDPEINLAATLVRLAKL